MINGTRIAWKGTKAFVRANTRMNVLTVSATREGGTGASSTGSTSYGLGFLFGFLFGMISNLYHWLAFKWRVREMRKRVLGCMAVGRYDLAEANIRHYEEWFGWQIERPWNQG